VTTVARLSLCLLLLAGVDACSSNARSTTASTTTTISATGQPSSTTAPATTPTATMPTATITLAGAVGLAGPASKEGVRCNLPGLDGFGIAVLAVPPDGTSLARIAVGPGRVKVIVGAGDGADYHERAFQGSGVTAFDAARRAVVDSPLTEIPETTGTNGTTKGDIGAVTSIEGTVECGDQTPGTSTVTLTGKTPEGALTAAVLDPAHVECDPSPQGAELVASGLLHVGATRALVTIGLTSDGAVTVDEMLPTTNRRYTADGIATVTTKGAHVRADVVDQNAPVSASRLHVEGNLVCGRNAAG
jgi:hypothetical protein